MSSARESKRSLLLVGFYFMNTRSAGGHRLQAMAKYMSRMGWDVSVLTASRKPERMGEEDEERAISYVPEGTRITRTRYLDLEWMWVFRSDRGQRQSQGASPGRKGAEGGVAGRSVKNFLAWWKTPARSVRGIIGFPDRQVGWFFPLLAAGWKHLMRNKIDVVVTSGPPHSSHLPFLILRVFFPFVWVTDFRDPWTTPPFYAVDPKSLREKRISLFFNRLLERGVHRRSDCILANTPGNRDALESSFGDDVRRKVVVLTNGFDEEISEARGGLDESAVACDFVFTGAVYHWMLDVYLESLTILRQNGKRMPTLHIFGKTSDEVKQRVIDLGFGSQLRFKGSVSYEESLWVLRNARALLLLFIGHRELFVRSVPSKLYAYVFSGRPYLALVPDGDAARILEDVGGGAVVKSREPREVASRISSFLESMDAGRLDLRYDAEALKLYSWSRLCGTLDGTLRTALEKRREHRVVDYPER